MKTEPLRESLSAFGLAILVVNVILSGVYSVYSLRAVLQGVPEDGWARVSDKIDEAVERGTLPIKLVDVSIQYVF